MSIARRTDLLTNQGRKRRKKCDETHDSCLGCLRNRLQCVWPTKEQEKDKRNLRRGRFPFNPGGIGSEPQTLIVLTRPETSAHRLFFSDGPAAMEESSYDTPMGSTGPSRLYAVPANTEESKSTLLFAAFMQEFLPSRIRPRSHPSFFQFAYTYDMAPRHPALLNACFACATTVIGAKLESTQAQIKADEFYARSVRALRTTIQNGGCEGTEDWLLATVIVLCLYENQKPAYNPASAAIHVAAAGRVFRQRALRKMGTGLRVSNRTLSSLQTRQALIFERIFAESFLYHSMMISIRNKDLAPLRDPLLRSAFDTYFEQCKISVSPEPKNWPILGMHYHIIRLISDLVVSLDNSLRTAVNTPKFSELEYILGQLGSWESTAIVHGHGLHVLLYISAAKFMAYCHLSTSSPMSEQFTALARQELGRCISTLTTVNINGEGRRYFNWPLAIIDKMAEDPRVSQVVQEKLEGAAHIDPAGKHAYNWLAEGFEQRFRPVWHR